MSTTKQSTVAQGSALEQLVSRHYEALGYQVERNVRLSNHQIDIVARRQVEGASPLCLVIDAKSRSKKNVGVNDVTAFLSVVRDLHSRNLITQGIMVTERAFSQDARGLVQGLPIMRLIRLVDLEEELLIGAALLHKAKGDLERTSAQKSYVPLPGLFHRYGDPQRINDIVKFVNGWVKKNTGLLAVLGDFGSGKSTLIERLFIEIADARQREQVRLYPILLRLRSLRQHADLWTFISANLLENQYISISKGLFFDRLQSGHLLMLLDGFDEIHTGANARERGAYLSRLSPLLMSSSPCVLTSRPTYFESRLAMIESFNSQLFSSPRIARVPTRTSEGLDLANQLAGVSVALGLGGSLKMHEDMLLQFIEVEGFGPPQILQFVEKRKKELYEKVGLSPEGVLKALYLVYHVEDLMSRPLLLSMIVELVVGGVLDLKDHAKSLGPSSVYEISTQWALTRDFKKGPENQFLNLGERQEVCRQLALKMLEKSSVELTAEDVTEAVRSSDLNIVKKSVAEDLPEIVERIETDVRVCSFLRFSGDGTFRFAHKSYFEFFVAQYVHMALEDPRKYGRPPFSKLTWEVIFFLSSYVRDLPVFWEMVQRALVDPQSYHQAQRNCLARVALASGRVRGRLKEVSIDKVLVRSATLESLEFSRVVLSQVEISDSKLIDWKSKELILSDTLVDNSNITNSQLQMRGKKARMERCRIVNSTLELSDGDWLISGANVADSTLILDGKVTLAGLQAENCHLTFGADGIQPGSSIKASHSQLSGPLGLSWVPYGVQTQLKNCLLGGLVLSELDATAFLDELGNSKETWLANCSGLLILSGFDEMHTPSIQKRLEQHLPRLAVASASDFNDAIARLRSHVREAKKKTDEESPMPVGEAIRFFKRVKNKGFETAVRQMAENKWLSTPAFSNWRKLLTPQ
jgi:hypothetical protein